VIAVRDDRDRLATFGPAHDLSPRRLILGADNETWLAHAYTVDGSSGLVIADRRRLAPTAARRPDAGLWDLRPPAALTGLSGGLPGVRSPSS